MTLMSMRVCWWANSNDHHQIDLFGAISHDLQLMQYDNIFFLLIDTNNQIRDRFIG